MDLPIQLRHLKIMESPNPYSLKTVRLPLPSGKLGVVKKMLEKLKELHPKYKKYM